MRKRIERGSWTECEWEISDCERRAKVKVGELKYCVKHYNETRRRARQAIRRKERGDPEEVVQDIHADLKTLEWEMQIVVNQIEDAASTQCQCTTISCAMGWRKILREKKLELTEVLGKIATLEENPIVAREKYFQEKVRKELKRIGWSTRKVVGGVSNTGQPDLACIAPWGGIALIEFKGGMPFTEREALAMLHGPQVSVLTDYARFEAPCIMCVGELEKGTIVEIGGLLDKDKCGILHYVHVAEVACQIEGWLRAWIREAPTKWGKEVDEHE